ncbi:hypothetical protein RHMOL_Rhmol02G0216900 [Rhododendron molle]|uniref:Uncharacterized protein n=1 Tax=Rhododendron molle TaxID=49168 RepID=A0ACC0PT42_RHOML|nr:hypothetical protein RHMOL_Rhmol02G0216900 [Rhododendron molle]
MGVSDKGRWWMGVADKGCWWTGCRRNIAFFPPSPDLKNRDERKIFGGLGVTATALAEDGEEAAGVAVAEEGDHEEKCLVFSYVGIEQYTRKNV